MGGGTSGYTKIGGGVWYASENPYPIYDFSRAFAFGLINNDEKVASSKQHNISNSRIEYKTLTILRPNGQNG